MNILTVPLDQLAREIHTQNLAAGWWDLFPVKRDRHETAMMLVISELSEAMEGHRKSLPDDHLPHHPMFSVELADALIRLLDLAGAYEMWLENVQPEYHGLLQELPNRTPPEQLYFVCQQIGRARGHHAEVRIGIAGVLAMASHNEIDLMPIVAEKRAYNATREDHKKEVRVMANGKTY